MLDQRLAVFLASAILCSGEYSDEEALNRAEKLLLMIDERNAERIREGKNPGFRAFMEAKIDRIFADREDDPSS